MSQEQTQETTAPAPAAGANQWTRLALEIGPLVAFFITNGRYGIMVGTAVFMVATAISVVISLVHEKRVPFMPIIGCAFVMLFGGLTLWLDDALFIKIKPTVVNLLFAAILLIGAMVGRHPLKLMMGSVLDLKEEGWRILTLRWGIFFIVLAVINEVVWRNFSTDFWVSFKLFGLMPLTLLFGLAQIPVIMRYQEPESGQADAASDG
ncbi:MAG: septation protein A [Pseudomonadota bacterium]